MKAAQLKEAIEVQKANEKKFPEVAHHFAAERERLEKLLAEEEAAAYLVIEDGKEIASYSDLAKAAQHVKDLREDNEGQAVELLHKDGRPVVRGEVRAVGIKC